MVILLMHINGIQNLAQGHFSFGGEASGTAGNSAGGVGGNISSGEPLTLVYTDRAGLYGGATSKEMPSRQMQMQMSLITGNIFRWMRFSLGKRSSRLRAPRIWPARSINSPTNADQEVLAECQSAVRCPRSAMYRSASRQPAAI